MPQDFKLHFIDLNFLKVRDDALRKRLLAMPTSFRLDAGQVEELIDTGVSLLKESKAFQALIRGLESE